MQLSVKIVGIDEIKKRLAGLPKQVEQAEVAAINKIAAQAFTQASRSIREEYNLKAKDLAKAIKKIAATRRAGQQRMFAMISAKGWPIPLYKFEARPQLPPSQMGIPVSKRRPVTVKVLKGGSRIALKSGFLAKMRTGHIGIFRRTGKESLPIKELYTPGIPKVFIKVAIPAMNRIVLEKGLKIFKDNLAYYLVKAGVIK